METQMLDKKDTSLERKTWILSHLGREECNLEQKAASKTMEGRNDSVVAQRKLHFTYVIYISYLIL